MRANTGIPSHDLTAVGDVAKMVEANGFHGVSTQENRHNPFLPLAIAATQTSSSNYEPAWLLRLREAPWLRRI